MPDELATYDPFNPEPVTMELKDDPRQIKMGFAEEAEAEERKAQENRKNVSNVSMDEIKLMQQLARTIKRFEHLECCSIENATRWFAGHVKEVLRARGHESTCQ